MLLLAALVTAGCSDDSPDPEPTDAGSPIVGSPDPQVAVGVEVESVAPALESYYRGTTYPTTLADAVASLADAGIQLAPGLSVTGYVYDADDVEFTLCIEDDESGAWASYDTAPMSVRDGGDSGGCP